MLLQLTFSQNLVELKADCLKKISEEEYSKILIYSSAFFNNKGNFKGFGGTKFIPDVNAEIFEKFYKCSLSYKSKGELMDYLYNSIKDLLFAYENLHSKLGIPNKDGFSGYYSSNFTEEEIKFINEFMGIINLSEVNSRLIKENDENFSILIGSYSVSPPKIHYYKTKKIKVIYGDYGIFLRRLSFQLSKSLNFTANLMQLNMMKAYIKHFETGDIETHKDSQRYWVRDVGPVVETNLGFVENYQVI